MVEVGAAVTLSSLASMAEGEVAETLPLTPFL